MPDVPIEIANEEAIVRGICSPYHVSSKGKLKPEAYDPSPATDEVSVIRHAYVGSDFCKKKAKELEDREKRKIYQGLAVLSARQIRSVGSEVVDSRQIFFGHADIKHGFDLIEGEPLPPEQALSLRDRTKKLAKLANYFPDPDPASIPWTGQKLAANE